MDERRGVEILRKLRSQMFYVTADEAAALDHAIATIERVAGAPSVAVPLGKAELALTAFQLGEDEPDSLIESAKDHIAEARRRLPDPQPDGQEVA